jgi:acyl-CoA hydrolase
MLKMLGREEVDSALHDLGQLAINCDFCGKHYEFDKVDCAQLFAADTTADAIAAGVTSSTKHARHAPLRLPAFLRDRHPLDGQRRLRPRQQRPLLQLLRYGGEPLPDRTGRARHPRRQTVGFVVETGCSYFRSIAFPDTVHVGVRVAKLGNSSVRYEIGLYRNDDELPAAAGHFVHVYVDRESNRPVPIPGETKPTKQKSCCRNSLNPFPCLSSIEQHQLALINDAFQWPPVYEFVHPVPGQCRFYTKAPFHRSFESVVLEIME